ncbi:hypothetical protein [Wenjunlia tyrosinilytica]|uniref:Uncharacterized protein n=1 Tax=Wenjunlia tyrosinilytica TaxID=1544741 RepID=A0A917ZND7_9ACTN|nr:hypothetical protein [Wenjunlia tyrosinilytica]GGO86280.1 hypothetical protein GCM10012280_22020 [Wenjunlia tyrosinilytica]
MAQTFRNIPLTLNTDGKAHPVENGFAAVTALLGLIAAITSIWPGLHLLSSWTGLIGVCTGLWAQMISATTAERFVAILGLGASAVGLYLGLAHGGLWGGVIG